MDRLETYTPQASVLGAIILQPELMGEAVLSLSEDDFQSKNCRICWRAMTSLFREGKSVDLVLLRDALKGFDGYNEFLASCMDAAPIAGNFQAHIQALKRQSMLVRLNELGTYLSDCSELEDALDLLAKGNEISTLNTARERRNMEQMMRSFSNRHSNNVVPDYLPWPLKPLNDGVKVIGGKLVVIGGYPSDGKTAFALQSAMVQADKAKRTAFYSFETDADTVEDRAIASIAQISMEAIKDNCLADDDWSRWAQSCAYANRPFDVIAASGMTVDDIKADALAHRYQVIYIDYLQLIEPSSRNHNFSRFDEVSEISRSIQRLAKTTGITVIALSQMSRPAADKKGNVPPPTMHNLRESGQIEQDADVIMLIYRLDQKNIRAPRYLDVVKNKEGRTGHWMLNFDGIHQSFTMADRQEPPVGMPKPKRHLRRTPCLNDENYEQYQIIEGDDPALPF